MFIKPHPCLLRSVYFSTIVKYLYFMLKAMLLKVLAIPQYIIILNSTASLFSWNVPCFLPWHIMDLYVETFSFHCISLIIYILEEKKTYTCIIAICKEYQNPFRTGLRYYYRSMAAILFLRGIKSQLESAH